MQLIIDVEFSFSRRPSTEEISLIRRGVIEAIEQVPDLVVTNLDLKFL